MFLLSVTEVAIPVSWYVVNSTNNIISYTSGGVSQSITVTQGNWDAKNLASAISSLQNHFGVSYDSTTMKFVISPVSTSIRFPTGSSLLSVSPMAAGTTSDFTGSIVDLTGTRSVFIKTNLSTRCIDSFSKGRSNILAKIPVLVASGQVLYYSNPGQFKTSITETDINVIEVLLLDENHQPLDFNGCNWSMTLQLDVIERSSEPLNLDKITSPLQVDGTNVSNQQNTESGRNNE